MAKLCIRQFSWNNNPPLICEWSCCNGDSNWIGNAEMLMRMIDVSLKDHINLSTFLPQGLNHSKCVQMHEWEINHWDNNLIEEALGMWDRGSESRLLKPSGSWSKLLVEWQSIFFLSIENFSPNFWVTTGVTRSSLLMNCSTVQSPPRINRVLKPASWLTCLVTSKRKVGLSILERKRRRRGQKKRELEKCEDWPGTSSARHLVPQEFDRSHAEDSSPFPPHMGISCLSWVAASAVSVSSD